jgi:hypothetical protein
MSKRLAYLEKVTSEGSKDPFAWYGLAMEYGNLGRHRRVAARPSQALRELDPGYVAMYLMCGNFLLKAGRPAEGRALARGRRSPRRRRRPATPTPSRSSRTRLVALENH